MLAGSGLTVIARVAAWLALVAVGAAHAVRLPLPPEMLIPCVVFAVPVALIAIGSTIAAIWRGPPIIAFAPGEGVRCGGEESEPVRAYAQLRGTMGGAGHVHPCRLVYPIVAWLGALAAGADAVAEHALSAGPWPFAVAVAGALGAWLFPSRPYWYREMSGGGALVSPPEAVAALAAREHGEERARAAALHVAGRADAILRERGGDLGAGAASSSAESPRAKLRDAIDRLAEEVDREAEELLMAKPQPEPGQDREQPPEPNEPERPHPRRRV